MHCGDETIDRGAGRARAGFTLVELLVVLILLAVLAAAVVVSLRGRAESRALDEAAEDVAASIRFALREARAAGLAHRLTFTDGVRGYRIERRRAEGTDFDPVDGPAGRGRVLPDGVDVHRVLRGDVPLTRPPEALPLDPCGDCFAGTIELIADGRVASVAVLPETFMVRVER